jgi:hypothetical protein
MPFVSHYSSTNGCEIIIYIWVYTNICYLNLKPNKLYLFSDIYKAEGCATKLYTFNVTSNGACICIADNSLLLNNACNLCLVVAPFKIRSL